MLKERYISIRQQDDKGFSEEGLLWGEIITNHNLGRVTYQCL